MESTVANLVYIIICLLYYFYFRSSSVYCCCRRKKRSKTFIRKHTKGAANYWLYLQLHESCNLGYFFYGNLLFLAVFALYLFLLVFSWLPFVRCPLIFTGIVLGLVQISNSFYATIQFNREYLGRPFVFFKVCRSLPGFYARHRIFFSFLDWVVCILPFGMYVLFVVKQVI